MRVSFALPQYFKVYALKNGSCFESCTVGWLFGLFNLLDREGKRRSRVPSNRFPQASRLVSARQRSRPWYHPPPTELGFLFFLFFSLSRPFLVSVSFGPAILFERACVVGYVDSLVAGVRHATVVCVVFVSQITGFFGPAILFE